MYLGSTLEGAIYETVFHDVPVTGTDQRIFMSAVSEFGITSITIQRRIRLASLRGPGLNRLGLRRAQLVDTTAEHYARTRRWAEALYAAPVTLDGLTWTSRRDDRAQAFMIFNLDRVEADAVARAGPTAPLGVEPMLSTIYQMCEESSVTLVG